MCTRGSNYQNPFGKDPNTNMSIHKKNNGTTPIGCKSMGVYPNFSPAISSLSVSSSGSGVYSLVYITGANFLPPSYGTTYVNFGSYTKLPIVFYSANNISFVVPIGAPPGIYSVKVVNVYNGNFSPAVNQSYPGNQNNSNALSYQIVGYAINTGTYSITSNSQYNTIITFTANSDITFYRNYAVNYIVVGGGGGGGGGNISGSPGAGGGGGGGVSTGFFNSNVSSYNITVGLGGLGGEFEITSSATPSQNGTNGAYSQISGVVIVSGGDYGLAASNSSNGGDSGNGGTGGIGDTSPGGNGNNGGGGGGGSYGSSIVAGYGSLSYTSVYYYINSFGAGGGGGGGDGIDGIAGNIYAGNGGGIDATANYGGGGGGGHSGNGVSGTYTNGGNGGSGVVILYFNA